MLEDELHLDKVVLYFLLAVLILHKSVVVSPGEAVHVGRFLKGCNLVNYWLKISNLIVIPRLRILSQATHSFHIWVLVGNISRRVLPEKSL